MWRAREGLGLNTAPRLRLNPWVVEVERIWGTMAHPSSVLMRYFGREKIKSLLSYLRIGL